MFEEISYALILGKPLILWLGVASLILLIITATIGYLSYTNRLKIQFHWHPRMAALTIIVVAVHAFFALTHYLFI